MAIQDKVASIVVKVKDEATNQFTKLGAGLVSLNQGVELAKKAWAAMSAMLKATVGEAVESEKVQLKLNQALRQHGNYSEEAAASADAFAQRLSNLTGIEDDQIKAAQAMLTGLAGLSGQGLDRATEAAANLAARFNIDLGTAANMIAKTIDGDAQALARMGIKAEGAAGSAARMADLLNKIDQVAGGAATQLEGAAVKQDRLKNSLNDSAKAIGSILLPAWSALLDMTQKVIDLINDKMIPTFKLAGAGMDAFIKILGGYFWESAELAKIKKREIELEQMLIKKREEATKTIEAQTDAQKKLTVEIKETIKKESAYEQASKEAGKAYSQQQETKRDEVKKTTAAVDAGNASGKKGAEELTKTLDAELAKYKELRDYFVDDLAKDIVDGNASINDSLNLVIKKIEVEMISGVLKNLIDAWFGVAQAAMAANSAQEAGAAVSATTGATTGGGAVAGAGGIGGAAALAAPAFIAYAASQAAPSLLYDLGFGKRKPKLSLTNGNSFWAAMRDDPEQVLKDIAMAKAANGFEGVVTRPTMFLTGEAGPERVSVTPKGKGKGSNSPVVINVVMDKRAVGRAVTDMQTLQRVGL